MTLVREWTPLFQVVIGMGREAMMELSVPEMVDMIDYAKEIRNG